METTRLRQREINSLAINTPNLKDWGAKGLKPNGNVIQGYYRLKDNRIIKLSDLFRTTRKIPSAIGDVEAQADLFPDLYDCKNIAFSKVVCEATGETRREMKKGFYQLTSGKIISLKKLGEAIEAEKKRIAEMEVVQ